MIHWIWSPRLLCLLLALFHCVIGKRAQLNCAVIIWGRQDYSIHRTADGALTSHCIQAVNLARSRCGGTALNFVPTHFWSYDPVKNPGGKTKLERFCYKTNEGDDQVRVECSEITQDMINEFRRGMRLCFREAVRLAFTTIKVTPHLDDGTGNSGWRNELELDPAAQYGGWTYRQVMIEPLVQALRHVIYLRKDTKVYFTMQGEMNKCLGIFPESWIRLMWAVRKQLRVPPSYRQKDGFRVGGKKPLWRHRMQQMQQLSANGVQPHWAEDDHLMNETLMRNITPVIKLGVSMNWNKLCGYYCPARRKAGGEFDMPNYRKLLMIVDFLGISNYPEVDRSWKNNKKMDFLASIKTFAQEFRMSFGIDLKRLLSQPGKEFHMSEFGIGGGCHRDGNCVSKTITEVAKFTYFGIYGTYGRFGGDPWAWDKAREFRALFYKHAIRWLAGQGDTSYRIDGAYIWCMSSWDVAGMYWTSWGPNGTGWYAKDIMDMIRDYNDNGVVPKV